MSRRSRGSVLDISIRGDEQEHNRIQLENNLQHTDLSFHLSSASEDDSYNPNYSVEYPRHNAVPTTFPDFASFERRSRDHFDDETHSQIHPWSYRTEEDEEGINPFGGESLSTAAHHASALTLSAGLGGGRGARRDISLSGAEYDPDRPLGDMIDDVDGKISAFDIEPSRSKYPGMGSVTFDPLVVDSTAELDRVLQSGYAPALASRTPQIVSPLHSSSSSSASDSENARPRITDALRRVSFSPQRPRSAQSNHSDRHHTISSPLARPNSLPNPSITYNAPTPKPTKRSTIFPPQPSSSTAAVPNPEVRLQPPTPSTAGSKFTKMARGLTKEIGEAQLAHYRAESSRHAPVPAGDKNPIDTKKLSSRYPSSKSHQTPRGKVQLPDVTGLTSAVESPAKLGQEYHPYRGEDAPREVEVRLLRTLNMVQTKLQHLEQENSISRRRVRELEMELEVCKREVARERTRVLEREETIVQQRRDASYIAASKKHKGKARAKDVSMEGEIHEKYKEAVEEKKALESLITSLRTHLARLTSELSSHRELLTELRNLRDSDSQMLQQKTAEIERLKEEVERLAGEVEVLRGVVEEGLRERRAVRDMSVVQSAEDITISEDLSDSDEYDGTEFAAGQSVVRSADERDEQAGEEASDYAAEDDGPEPFDPQSIPGSSGMDTGIADRTLKTDHATLGSSNLGTSGGGRAITPEELERISAEVKERRQAQHTQPPSPPPIQINRRVRTATVEDVTDQEAGRDTHRLQSSAPSDANLPRFTRRVPNPPQPSTSRLPVQSSGDKTRRLKVTPITETPFPQIRGAHLERLFFSAPEHNARTCTVCHQRRHRSDISPSWIPSRFRETMADKRDEVERMDDEEDEGFIEGVDELEHQGADTKGKQTLAFSQEPGPWRQRAQREGLPPQTVVARVIRELEDDFTHYKSVYVELADQYKDMDPVSDVPKRNMLAQHLREVVDILEQKGDQIASLYDLLSFKDKPVSESIVPDNMRPAPAAPSWGRAGKTRQRPTGSVS